MRLYFNYLSSGEDRDPVIFGLLDKEQALFYPDPDPT